MLVNQRKVAETLLKQATMELSTYFGRDIKIDSLVFLSEPERRNILLRLNLSSKISVILKQHMAQKNPQGDQEALGRFARDWSAHMFLGKLSKNKALVPICYGGSVEHRFILLEDLGPKHISLVDALTGVKAEEAKQALGRYTTQMADLHGLAYKNLADYNVIFNKFNIKSPEENTNYDDAMREIVPVLHNLGIILNSDIKKEIKHVLKTIKQPNKFTTLIHGDLCPDNVFDDPEHNKLRIIDFEWSSLSNALLDGVFIRMNMPTCWCAKAFPLDLIDELEILYRTKLAQNIPAAQDDLLYFESYSAACAYWMLWNVIIIKEIWDKDSDLSDPKFLNLHKNWRPEYQLRRPRVLSRIGAFIEISKKHDTLPHLREMAIFVLYQLQKIWPDAEPMGRYRAFL